MALYEYAAFLILCSKNLMDSGGYFYMHLPSIEYLP
jgi:hypothetical protein